MSVLILLIGIAVQLGIAIQPYAREDRYMAAIRKDKECIPFEAHYESLKKLSSGTVLQKKTGMLYRDSKCRQRVEDRFEIAPGEVITFVHVDDPINHTSHVVCIESKTVFYKGIFPSEGFSVWTFDAGSGPGISLPLLVPQRSPDFEARQIAGLKSHGYLLRVSAEYIVEYWYSIDLNQLMLVRIPSDEGEYTWRLFDISLTEQDESLFTVPLDFKDAHTERCG